MSFFRTKKTNKRMAAVAAAAVSVVAGGITAGMMVQAHGAAPTTGTTATPSRTPIGTPGAPFTTVRMVAGAPVTDANGYFWASDSGFIGGRIYDSKRAIIGAKTSELYSRERVAVAGYAIPVGGPGTYRVTLREAEIWYDAKGKRVFDVKAEGATKVSDLDIFAAAGGKFRYHKVIFDSVVNDGVLNLDFVAKVNDPKIGSIQVDRLSGGPTTTAPKPSNTATTAPKPSGPATATPTRAAGPISAPTPPGSGTEAAVKFNWGRPVVVENMDNLNNFGQAYKASADWGRKTRANLSISNGMLNIVGKSDGTTGGIGHKHSQKYGRWEARMQVGGTEGCWRPVLLLWRDSGSTAEIDYSESKGSWSGTRFFLHYGGGQTTANVSVDATKWVNYAVEWTPTAIRGFVNGKQFFEDKNKAHFPSVTMHQTFQLDAQKKTGICRSNAWMKVDWLKVYK